MTGIVAGARRTATPQLLAQALNNLANGLVIAGRPTEALAHATEAVRLLAARPDDPRLISATLTRAESLHAVGRHRAALATAQHALTLGQAQGNLRIESQTRHFIATVKAALTERTPLPGTFAPEFEHPGPDDPGPDNPGPDGSGPDDLGPPP
jgi:tetratricopeptide (TPR) repeat protein